MYYLEWAREHHAEACLACVGIACKFYPDKRPVTTKVDIRSPIRHGGYVIAYEGLGIMTISDRIKTWDDVFR
jgi:hypothetical protein